ncbi:MAG: glycosyltransferase family 4 protein, partial [bacterium]
MKIALIRSSVHRRGGVERYVWLLARELDRRGHEVHLLARRCPELPAPSVRFHPIRAWGPFSFLKVLSFARGVQGVLEG